MTTRIETTGGEILRHNNTEAENDMALGRLAAARYARQNGPAEWNHNPRLFMKRQILSTVLHHNELYQKILHVPGVICEFGVQWGSTLTTLTNLRGIYEPFNHARRIYGFDTFEGFPDVAEQDGGYSRAGDYATWQGYENDLAEVLRLQESFSPIPHIEKFELIKGDASVTAPQWLERNPHAIVSMCIFDMDIYQPTKDVLEAMLPRFVKGTILVFDQLNCPHWPGETRALDEVLGLNNIRLQRTRFEPYTAWAEFGA